MNNSPDFDPLFSPDPASGGSAERPGVPRGEEVPPAAETEEQIRHRAQEMAITGQIPGVLDRADPRFSDAYLKARQALILGAKDEKKPINKVPEKWKSAEYTFTPGAGRFPVTMEIPILLKDRMAWMRDLLGRIEAKGADVNSDPSFRQEMENMYAAITYLMSEEYKTSGQGWKVTKDDSGREIGREPVTEEAGEIEVERKIKKIQEVVGEMMHDEFIRRLAFHNAFLAFTEVPNGDELGKVANKVGGDVQNTLLRTPEFVWISFYFELHAEEYCDTYARGADGSILKDNEGNDLFISDDEAHERFRKKAEAWFKEQARLNPDKKLDAENAEWGARLVERKFMMDGRKATFAQTRPAERDSKITGKREKGYKFLDYVGHGDEVLRKTLRMEDWAKSNDEIDNLKANWQLVKNVDWKTNDYVQELMSDVVIEAVRKATMKKDENGIPVPYNPDGTPTFVDLTRAFFIVKNGKDVKVKVVRRGGKTLYYDPDDNPNDPRVKPLDKKLIRLDFREIDFSRFSMGDHIGGRSMEYWVGKRIKTMEVVRDLLVGKPESYLRQVQPDEEVLKKQINEVLAYQKDERWENLIIMADDYVDWKSSKEYKAETGFKPLNPAEKELALLRLASAWGLSKEQTKAMMNRVFGDGLTEKFLLFYYRYDVGPAFLEVLWTIILGVGAAAMNPKAA